MCIDYQNIDPLGIQKTEKRRRKELVKQINENFRLIEYYSYKQRYSRDIAEKAFLSDVLEDLKEDTSCMIADISN